MNEKTKNFLIIIISIIILIALITFASYLITNNKSQETNNYQNQVQEIIDGDTFTLTTGEKVRLLCINTPEKGEEGYEEAISFLGGKILYENLTLEGNETDRYGRLLRWVWVGDELVNKEIVDKGVGEVFVYGDENCSLIR